MPDTNSAGGVNLLMLHSVCQYCRNYFFRSDRIFTGTFTIADGNVTCDGVTLSDMVKPGQYYLIAGSDLNDGIHQRGRTDDTLEDEVFYGNVYPLSIPKAFLALVSEIADWQTKNGAIVTSPFSSESFGGYQYSKASPGADGTGVSSWKDIFASRLRSWRKL